MQSLTFKLALTTSLVTLATVAGLGGLFMLQERETRRAAVESQAQAILSGLEATTLDALASRDVAALQASSAGLGRLPAVEAVWFYDHQGQLLASLQPAEATLPEPFAPVAGSLSQVEGPQFQWSGDALTAWQAVTVDGELEGIIGLQLAVMPANTATGSSSAALLLVGAGAVIAALAVSLGFGRALSQPLEDLKRTLQGETPSSDTPADSGEPTSLAGALSALRRQWDDHLRHHTAVLEAIPLGVMRLDDEGTIQALNPAAETLFAISSAAARGRKLSEFIPRLGPGGSAPQIGALPNRRQEGVGRNAAGHEFPVEVTITSETGTESSPITVIVEDLRPRQQIEQTVSQTQAELEARVAARTAELAHANAALEAQMEALARAEQALRESEERYSLAVRGANDGIWDWDLKRDRIYFSPRWKAILGFAEDEIGDDEDEWFGQVHPQDIEQLKSNIATHLKGLSSHFESEYRIRHKDGTYRWVLSRGLAVRDEQGNAYRMAGSLSDINERKHFEQQLVHDAFHDALTGLPNRALFIDRLGRAIERTKRRNDYLFAVLFLDLDRFKVINDSLGHTVGDQLLVAIARRLEIFLRTVDTVARLGGDEFVILLEDIENEHDATLVAERIQGELGLPFYLNGQKVFTTVSIGIVLSTAGYTRPEEILRDADIAMYRAKAMGRSRHEVFDTDMRDRAMARLELETDLRRAIGFQEFLVFYQPIISLTTNRITGFEALVRWQHPQRGLLFPEEFIHVAEETGLIIPIDWWVLREACQQLASWQKQYPTDPPLTISVNVSSQHFSRLDLVDQIQNILQVTSLDPSCLKLEITESVFMEDDKVEHESFVRLQELGVQLQIDDFGTGYSSLGYLQRFPVDTIKIDRSFVSKMDGEVTNSEIVRTIVTLARELEIAAIAEGVETPKQMAQLKDLQCEYGQGFLISRPLDSEASGQLIADMIAGIGPGTKQQRTP